MIDPEKVAITTSVMFEEHEARITFGMSLEEYEKLPGTPEWIIEGGPQYSKCHVIAWYRLHNRIGLVQYRAGKT